MPPTKTRSPHSDKRARRAPPDDPVTSYARDVVAGRVVAGRLVQLAGARHLRDLDEGPARGLKWSWAHAQHALDFFPGFLCLAEGEHAGRPFRLQPWQTFIVGSLFGWLGPDRFRRFSVAYIEAAKGNGKSPLLAGIGLYLLTFDDEPGAEVYCAAVTADQARIVFRDATRMVQASPWLAKHIDVTVNNLAVLDAQSFLRPISSEGHGLDGKRVHGALIDEIHEHRTPIVCDKMRAGIKGRRQGLVIEITNSGYDRETICWYHHAVSTQVLDGVLQLDNWFAYVCQLDPCDACRGNAKDQPQEDCPDCDDWRAPAAWVKANPNLDVSITRKYLAEQVAEAIASPPKTNIVKRLNFCIWTQRISRWIDVQKWLACGATVPAAELVGVPCYAGLDLAQSDDFCAFVVLWLLPDERAAVEAHFWLPSKTIDRVRDRPYQYWLETGALTVTDGEIADPAAIEAFVTARCREAGVRELAYDNRFTEQMAVRWKGAGITAVNTPQGYHLNEALRKLNDLCLTEKLCHGGNAILAWMAANATVRHGTQGEIRLIKDSATAKVDGIAALAMALSRAIVLPPERPSVYEGRGVIAL